MVLRLLRIRDGGNEIKREEAKGIEAGKTNIERKKIQQPTKVYSVNK
jgi:paraquat-inducible protein B